MECPNCYRTYDNGFKFCPYCGEKKPEPKICPNCKFRTFDEEFMFCPECREKLILKTEYERLEKVRKDEDEERLKNKYKKMVDDADLDSASKSILKFRINENKIIDIKDEIRLEKRQTERRREKIRVEKRKKEFREIVNASELDSTSKSVLINLINQQKIITESKLKEEIEIEKRKKELLKIFEFKELVEGVDLDSTSRSDILTKINQNKFTSEKELEEEIIKEKNKTVIREEEIRKKSERKRKAEQIYREALRSGKRYEEDYDYIRDMYR